MGRIVALSLALTFGMLALVAHAGPLAAQARPAVLAACGAGEEEILASKLPEVVELEECPVRGRKIVDKGIEVVLPPRGRSVHAESLNVGGAQELVISHLPDGTIELAEVGDDSAEAEERGAAAVAGAAATAPRECSDAAYTNFSYRLGKNLQFFFNRSTTPSELTPLAAEAAVKRAGTNVANTRNACGLGDRVPVGLSYAGATRSAANVTSSGGCAANDGRSVVSFGPLPRGVLAVACTYYAASNGRSEATASDVRVGTAPTWTVNPTATSCRNRYDLEAVMTHERGHTFGLNHVSESGHGNLTMSTQINGPCQLTERTLGRGDVLGLDKKYP